jgi:hypothetical protein
MIALIHPDKNNDDRANSATQSEAVMRSKQGELSKIKPGREAGYPAVDATSATRQWLKKQPPAVRAQEAAPN